MVRRRSTVRFRKGARSESGRVHLDSGRSGCSRSGVAQSVEQAAHNRCVAGSSPATATRLTELPQTRKQEAPAMARPPTSGRRSRWRARSASTATTSPRRTGGTTPTGWRSRSSARTATCTATTARPGDRGVRRPRSAPDPALPGRTGEGPGVRPRRRRGRFRVYGPRRRPRAPGTRTWWRRRRSRSRSRIPLMEAFLRDPAVGWDYAHMVHGEQSFVLHRPLYAGDEVVTTLHVDELRTAGGEPVPHAARRGGGRRGRARGDGGLADGHRRSGESAEVPA